MNRSTLLLVAMAFWLVAYAALFAAYYPRIPDPVAIHFNAQGEPDNWTGKGAFLGLMVLTLLPVVGLFPLLWLLAPRMPDWTVNLPHKQYWLAPERRAWTMEVVREFLMWTAHLTAGLMWVILLASLEANLRQPPRLADWALWGIGGYTVLILVLALWLHRRFARLPGA